MSIVKLNQNMIDHWHFG